MLQLLVSILCLSAVSDASLDAVYNDIQQLREGNELLHERVDYLQNANQRLREAVKLALNTTLIEGTIAFSALKSSTQSVAPGDVIQFPTEYIDTHGLFNENVGIFTVPQDGIYEFTVTLYKTASTTTSYNSNYGDLYVGGTFLTRIYNHFGSDTGAAAHSTSSIIREFSIGDSVYVRSDSTGSFYGSTSYMSSQFSGSYLGPMPATKY